MVPIIFDEERIYFSKHETMINDKRYTKNLLLTFNKAGRYPRIHHNYNS